MFYILLDLLSHEQCVFLIHEHLSRPMSVFCQYMTLLRFVCTYIAFLKIFY